ncbi:MAG: TetR/AcrR family transcriptional regulator [Pseudomonadales bacterium]
MPRPSVKAERTEEILDAFERCVVHYGVDGATLERIAAEAALQRSLLRHYIGNREALIEALLKRFLKKSAAETKELFDALPAKQRAAALLDYLFDEQYSDSQLALVASALIAAAASHDHLRSPLRRWIGHFVDAVAEELQRSFPSVDSAACVEVAAGIVGIYFNVESLAPLGRMKTLRTGSKNAAERLISTLGHVG